MTIAAEAARTGYNGEPVVAQTFGSGIARDASKDRYDYDNVVNPDKEANSSTWQTVAKENSEFKTSFSMGKGMSAEKLEEYRQKWTKDTPDSVEVRFGKWKK